MSHLFFDLDGTLTDPVEGITRSVQYALESLGEEVPSQAQLTWCIGPPLYDNFVQLLGEARAAEGVALYRERFAEVGWHENVPYQGIHEALAALSRTHRLYVASSKPHLFVNQILERFELRAYFSMVFGSELDGTRADKGELLTYALAKANVDMATMIGDRKHDVIGGQANGLRTAGVLYGYGSRSELEAAGADVLVDQVGDLASIL